MVYDLDSYLTRKRITLEEFATKNNIRTVDDIGMFILNNKEFVLSDALVQKLTDLCDKEPENVEDMLFISANVFREQNADSLRKATNQDTVPEKVDDDKMVSMKKPARKSRKTTQDHSSSAANRS